MRTTSDTNAPAAAPSTPDQEAEEAADARVAGALAESGIAVCQDFCSAADVGELAAECRRAALAGELAAAHVGRGSTRERGSEIRGDSIRWLRPSGSTPGERALLERMERLRLEINRRSYRGLFDFECHFSLYPAGAVYRRHLDRFHDGGTRVVSCVLYLNEQWCETDGGCLRLHTDAGGGHLDVLPIGGTLVAFSSADHEHEVLAARRERMSIAGWFRTAAR